MPFLSELSHATEWMDPDLVPRPIVTFGATGTTPPRLSPEQEAFYRDRRENDFHQHIKGQLLLAQRGILSCEIEGGLWMVPPQSAIWIPCQTQHKVTASGPIECYIMFISPQAASALPPNCCTVSISPLLRELLVRAAAFPLLYPEGGLETHLATLLLDEIAIAPTGNLHLPMPTDARLRKIVSMITDTPAERGTIQSWAKRVGLSERTLARLLAQETGMSFGRWRQQLHIMLAVKWLGTGSSVQQVADDLGYESAGSFVTMFRKAIGTSPARYMAQRRGIVA
ncbi:MAG: HTH-type transcriptional regulator NimR [Herbaspirillum frisingense]|uniref:HTH-type transcriptional regulator NimR n=1 Tax=Herbaspirillum frisingense TaxID=92645 RepID=A0A7V8FWZ7_9BURK|nr:MAG: HTH-type transcriptional regulator NimR [Herbaspirillum frisingense]